MKKSSPPPVPHREPAVLPALSSSKPSHRYCIDIKIDDLQQQEGALRLCMHGKIQEIHGAPYLGGYWRDIHPLLNPIRHHRAAEALIAAGIARSI